MYECGLGGYCALYEWGGGGGEEREKDGKLEKGEMFVIPRLSMGMLSSGI